MGKKDILFVKRSSAIDTDLKIPYFNNKSFAFNSFILPLCPPSISLPEKVASSMSLRPGLKYYASETLGSLSAQNYTKLDFANFVQKDPSEIISNNAKIKNFVNALVKMLFANDVCDQNGIQYVAKAYNDACNHTQYPLAQKVCEMINNAQNSFALLVKAYANVNMGGC